jgi:hypothetical protein
MKCSLNPEGLHTNRSTLSASPFAMWQEESEKLLSENLNVAVF